MNAFSRARLPAAGVSRRILPGLRYFSQVLHLISSRELRSQLMEVILRKGDCAQRFAMEKRYRTQAEISGKQGIIIQFNEISRQSPDGLSVNFKRVIASAATHPQLGCARRAACAFARASE
jgi:hypothetical protein